MKKNIIRFSLLTVMFLSVIWIVWLSLTPLIDRDALRFHLPFAKLWAENGFLYFRRYFAFYDLNMLNLNYLYMLVFKFGLSDQFTKIIHGSFLIGGGYLIYRYFREKYNFRWGALAFIFYITIPVHQRLASEVYTDLGLLFFSTLAIIYLIKWFENDFTSDKYLLISAIGAGLGFGTKYNGMIIAFFLTLFVALMITREKKDDKLALKSMALYGTIILISVSPWLVRNFIDSGNPFYPLFTSFFNSDIIELPELVAGFDPETANRIINGQENIIMLFLIPIRTFFEGADHDFLKYDGVLNPFLILLLPFIFYPKFSDPKKKKTLMYLFAIFLIVYLVTLYSNNIRIRYFIPVLPILIILNIEALKNIYSSNKIKPFFYFFSVCFISFNIYYGITLYNTLSLSDFNPFSRTSKENYLRNHVINYDFFEYINQNTPKNSVIYEALTGGRSYYVERTFYCDTTSLDRYLLELADKGASKEDYDKYFRNLPNSDLAATHILIRPNDFIKLFFDLYFNQNDPGNVENSKKIRGFVEFFNSLKLLKENAGVCLFGKK